MGVHIEDNKLVIITEPKTIHFNLSKNFDNSFKYEISFIINHKKHLAEHAIKNKISQLLSKYKPANDIHKHRKQ